MEKVKIVTFNIRIPEADQENSWTYRKPHVIEKINKEQPDIISFQEIMPESLKDLKQELKGYVFVGCPREADYSGEAVMMAYKVDRVDLLCLEVFWLSKTPSVPGSKYSDIMTLPRTCLMAEFRTLEGKFVRIYNTHLDHLHTSMRIAGMQTVLEHIEARQTIKRLPTLLMGDFNAIPQEQEIQMIKTLTDITSHIPISFHDYGRRDIKIDYIYVNDLVNSENIAPWLDSHNGVYLSDHYPIAVEVLLD